ncbi:MAG: flagellar hook-length control protein FliK [Candidatus Muiribacteriota bacterium]
MKSQAEYFDSNSKSSKTEGSDKGAFSDLFNKIKNENESENEKLDPALTEKIFNKSKLSEQELEELLEKLNDLLQKLPEELVSLIKETLEKIGDESEKDNALSAVLDEVVSELADSNQTKEEKLKLDSGELKEALDEINALLEKITQKSISFEIDSHNPENIELEKAMKAENSTENEFESILSEEYSEKTEKKAGLNLKDYVNQEKKVVSEEDEKVIKIIEKEVEDDEGKKVFLKAVIEVEKTNNKNKNVNNVEFNLSEKEPDLNHESVIRDFKNHNNNFERVTEDATENTHKNNSSKTNASDILKNIYAKVNYSNSSAGSQMNFKMKPEELGQVNVSVFNDNGKITIRMIAQTEGARQALQSGITELRQNVLREGVKVQDIAVEVDPDAQKDEQNQKRKEDKNRKDNKKKIERRVNFKEVMQAFETREPSGVFA